MPINVEDLLSYGIEWDINQKTSKCKRIGNLAYHKSLPIQSQMKGCILDCINKKVVYWLDEDDWNYCQNPSTVIPDHADISETYISINFDPTKVSKPTTIERCLQITYIKINGISINVSIEESTTYIGYVKFNIYSANDNYEYVKELASHLSDCVIELGSILNGYDGEVFVHIPKFYIKSYDNTNNDNKKWVKISEVKIDDTWTELGNFFISPYLLTLNKQTIDTNAGYLDILNSTEEANNITTLVSVVNKTAKCRGGFDEEIYDTYINTNPIRSCLGKPTSIYGYGDLVDRCYNNSFKEVMNYKHYKAIVWLYVVEYANRNVQEEYIEELTSDGYRQGGLGKGLGYISDSFAASFNNKQPMTPCGYSNEFGNRSAIKKMVISDGTTEYIKYVPRYRGIEWLWGQNTALAGYLTQHKKGTLSLYYTDDPKSYKGWTSDNSLNWVYIGSFPDLSGMIIDIKLGNAAEYIGATKVSNSEGTPFADWQYSSKENNNLDMGCYLGCNPTDSIASGLFGCNLSFAGMRSGINSTHEYHNWGLSAVGIVRI